MKTLIWLSALFAAGVFGEAPSAKTPEKPFVLLDKVCVLVEGEDPILLSEIRKRVEQKQIGFRVAQKELIRERLLWVYAKKQLKYDVASVYKATDEHLSKVMEKNRLSRSQFDEVLMAPPYLTSFRQFRLDTATDYLQNTIMQNLSSQISVSDEQLKLEAAKKYEVIFITIHPKQVAKAPISATVRPSLSAEFKKANEIRGKIQPTTNVNDIKMLYGKDKDISIIGPIAYDKDVLKKSYDERLKSESSDFVIGPFEDDGSVTVIWKIKKTKKNLDETALEKLRKESYHNAVLEKFNALTDALINSSTVIEKGCDKL